MWLLWPCPCENQKGHIDHHNCQYNLHVYSNVSLIDICYRKSDCHDSNYNNQSSIAIQTFWKMNRKIAIYAKSDNFPMWQLFVGHAISYHAWCDNIYCQYGWFIRIFSLFSSLYQWFYVVLDNCRNYICLPQKNWRRDPARKLYDQLDPVLLFPTLAFSATNSLCQKQVSVTAVFIL